MGLAETIDSWTARASGRSFWLARYTDGRMVHELQLKPGDTLPRKGLQAMRLYCPSGEIAELGNSVGAGERLFYLNQSRADAIVGPNGGMRRTPLWQLIGLLTGPDGSCTCAAWNYEKRALETFADNIFYFRYGQTGLLSADALGLKV